MDMFQCISHRQKQELKKEDTSNNSSDKNTSSDD